MNGKIYSLGKKYKAQDCIVCNTAFKYLDERTLYEIIKVMLLNTSNDCIKYENDLDPEMEYISNIMVKENKTEEEIQTIKESQEKLKVALHLSEIAESSLHELLYEMVTEDNIKNVFKDDMPELYESVYSIIDLEDDVIDAIFLEICESYEPLTYKQLCGIINNCIINIVNDVEEFDDEIEEHDFYEEFVDARNKANERREAKENE